jgi:hypothetical protein
MTLFSGTGPYLLTQKTATPGCRQTPRFVAPVKPKCFCECALVVNPLERVVGCHALSAVEAGAWLCLHILHSGEWQRDSLFLCHWIRSLTARYCLHDLTMN